jgi:hypothetical protein
MYTGMYEEQLTLLSPSFHSLNLHSDPKCVHDGCDKSWPSGAIIISLLSNIAKQNVKYPRVNGKHAN